MIATERFDYILKKLEQETTVTIKDIATSLHVSEATVRRDFERLEQKGLALRVRAGATKVDSPSLGNVAPLITSEKLTEHMEEKNAIAKFAAGLIEDGQCIFLDGGTSVAQLIDFIQDKRVKIVTPNLLIPRKLTNMDMDIFLIGGRYMHFHESTVKEVAMRCAEKSVLLADSSKIGKTSVCRFSPISSFDNVIIFEPESISIDLPSNFTIIKE